MKKEIVKQHVFGEGHPHAQKPLHHFFYLLLIPFIFTWLGCEREIPYVITGEQTCWHTITIDFTGPQTSEQDDNNPFLNYRLNVLFSNGSDSLLVPGFYAADGQAGESGAAEGNVWKVKFTPDKPGDWTFKARFRQGENIAIDNDLKAGRALAFDGAQGQFTVKPADKSAPGFLGKGKLEYREKRYLQFAETGEYFIKGGAGSPENLLAYQDFDGTVRWNAENREGEASADGKLHFYEPHIKDWKEGDPTWRGGKGKGIIGGLNYLAAKGMNSVYFLTMNINGDGKDVWPYTGYEERLRFDCSKLDQWEIVFEHMDRLGLLLHMILQETENETLLDDGDTKFERKLYYRELIARFGHHLGVIWNMGEENGPTHWSPDGQSTEQQKAMVKYFKMHDPYQSLRVIHTHAAREPRHEMFSALLGDRSMDGMSMQIDRRTVAHEETVLWLNQSRNAGRQWVVAIDEIGHASRGVDPDDKEENNQDSVRAEVLWGNLMAGGSGVEWYFGYKNHNNDLQCEDWRSRDRMWDYTRIALDFFNNEIPFTAMESDDEMVISGNAWCLAKKREVMVLYLPYGGTASVDLSEAKDEYSVKWFNPREGGPFQKGSVSTVVAGGQADIGFPPSDRDKDWAVVVENIILN